MANKGVIYAHCAAEYTTNGRFNCLKTETHVLSVVRTTQRTLFERASMWNGRRQDKKKKTDKMPEFAFPVDDNYLFAFSSFFFFVPRFVDSRTVHREHRTRKRKSSDWRRLVGGVPNRINKWCDTRFSDLPSTVEPLTRCTIYQRNLENECDFVDSSNF